MSLKIKILLLSILPLVLVTTVVTLISLKEARQLSEQELETFERNLLEARQTELRNYVTITLASIAQIVADGNPRSVKTRQDVRHLLKTLNYGEDGYFFAYDSRGNSIVHPSQPDLEGRNLYDIQDVKGQYVVRDLLHIAWDGGGFHQYTWRKPSSGKEEEKISYVVNVPGLNWMLGTGIYIEDIATDVAKIRKDVDHNIRNTFFTVLVIVTGAVVAVALLGIAINVREYQMADLRLRKLAHRYVQVQVDQRRQFARDLHDGINQLMVSVKFRLELAREKLEKGNIAIERDLDKGCEVLNMAIQEARRISHDLRPSLLDDMGLRTALVNLMEDFEERSPAEVRCRVFLPDHPVPDDIEISIYRMVQEAISNIERHAKARNVSLDVWYHDERIWIEIKDNGVGFDTDLNSEGIGLIHMRERAELLSGDFSYNSRVGIGTRIRAYFPATINAADLA
ncbi:cache domain-containing protein [Marinobacterium jannaschii]|uniref:cache domain-containing protein n=1 Tax=Marinobacterium jannaschii TaxID=64970 RepID=UPI00055CBD7F|nr:cache domain-containing protein [Marinobacterium jannaschii]